VNLYYALHNGPFKFPVEEIQQLKFYSKNDALEFIKNDPAASFFSRMDIPMIFEFLEKK